MAQRRHMAAAAGVFLSAACLALSAQSEIPLPEHPRPDWERPQWLNLNGTWDFGFEKGVYDKKISVPFGWGSKLSGVKNEPGKDTGHYRRRIAVPCEWRGKRIFIVVGAADHDTYFSIDGRYLGRHSGGYVPFEYEITDRVRWGEEQTVEFRIWDPAGKAAFDGHYLYGKQGYGNARGIWQTVYLEARGMTYIDSVRFVPEIKRSSVRMQIRLSLPAGERLAVRMVFDGGVETFEFAPGEMEKEFEAKIASPKLWDLDNPFLYDVKLSLVSTPGRETLDEVSTYFGFREIGTGLTPNGDNYITLNGKPIYLQMCLDQSYHPDGWYTFPTDESMKNDLLISKRLALSGNRIHVKAEIPRKLYWADRLGLLIQADVPNAWGNVSDAMFAEHWKCFEAMVKRDFNHPSIYQWTLFNETWGLRSNRSLEMGLAAGKVKKDQVYPAWAQRKVAETYLKAKKADPTRIVEDNSPCRRDHVASDVNTWHSYMPGYEWGDRVERFCRETFPGSTNDYVSGCVQTGVPMMNSECGNVWGYTGSTGDCDFSWDYHLMINAFRRRLKCAGWLYTEHHDVIKEWNGYVRFDRSAKYDGMDELAGMTLADLHGKAGIVFCGPDGSATGEIVPAGGKTVIPVGVSLVTDEYAGSSLSLAVEPWWFDENGVKVLGERKMLPCETVAKSWHCEKLWDVPFDAPNGDACGCVVFRLLSGGREISRNFWSFSTVSGGVRTVKPSASKWSQGTAEVLGGLKVNGFGKGWFEYELPAPAQGGVFRAELSAKRKNGKDFGAEKKKGGLDFMLGGGTYDRSRSQNSYPQTSDSKHPANLKVYVDGALAVEKVLPDDPADHRGILSWLAQPRNRRLHEAGSYGYLVEVPVPASALNDGKVRIRLESDSGLAVYGPRFGRYPLGVSVGSR